MSTEMSNPRLIPCLPRGLVVNGAADLDARACIIDRICAVCERYGFDSVETPIIEYTAMLGNFLPDQDRPNSAQFSFQDDDDQWLSLRYDLTAPLARYVAEHFDKLPNPYRSYRTGYVFRNEKPGPGRFRQFVQFDADTVGTANVAADAELCMMAADCMESLGLKRGEYVIRANNRKLLDGVMETIGLCGPEEAGRRLVVLRAIDKLDRLGLDGVRLLLGAGRQDESGDFTRGADLCCSQIDHILTLIASDCGMIGNDLKCLVTGSDIGAQGVAELEELLSLARGCGFENDRIIIDPSVVRGLEYYTGPVYEAALLFETVNEKGVKTRFGSVGGGGRYDGLISRFRAEPVPATGFSIGISRLQAALTALGRIEMSARIGPVVVLVMDRDRISGYQQMVHKLHMANIKSEVYLGAGGMRAQMKYADRRCAPLVIIQGENERSRGEVIIKDLIEGSRLSKTIIDNKEWRESRPAQISIPESTLVEEVKRRLSV